MVFKKKVAGDSNSEAAAADAAVRKAARRMLAVTDARDDLLIFTQLMMPHPDDPDDIEKSRYEVQYFHKIIAEAMQRVERGEITRLIVTVPPRHGKTQLISKMFPAWYLGRNPYRSVIVTSYNDELAADSGRSVRECIDSPIFRQVFPTCKLRKGAKAADRMQVTEGGEAFFIGGESTITGRGGDIVLIDDPVKNAEEADSPTIREKMWTWFTQVIMSRLMTSLGSVVIVMTRWSEDDLVGRLTDSKNPCYNANQAKHWHILHLTGLADDNDVLGRKKGEALWPERISAEHMQNMREQNPRGFNANYQGRPTPEDGEFFKRNWLVTYQAHQLPKNLRHYCASDHAVGQKTENDLNCLLPIGLDENDDIWVLPDVFWRRCATDVVVEAMIDLMERKKPVIWWGENEHIFKSIGPFLFKRMQERNIYCAVEPVSPAKDKQVKAQAIRGRMSMKKVRFPAFAPWWPDALDQILKFPRGRHDDFVDALGHIGRGLGVLVRAEGAPPKSPAEPPSGTFAWIKWAAKLEKRERKFAQQGGF